MIPSAAFLIFAEQTRRMCLPGGNTEDTRRLLRKLIIHFAASGLPESRRLVAEANLAAVDPVDPTTYALLCLSVLTRIVREEELDARMRANLDLLPKIDRGLRDLLEQMGGKHAR